MTDAQKVKECIVLTALYYGREMSPPVLAMMARDLEGYPADKVIEAFQAYRRNGKNRAFPLPAQIIEILEGGNSRLNGNALATKLIAAVQRHDRYWCSIPNRYPPYIGGSFQAEFIHELGEEAWHVVKNYGGWPSFCDVYWNNTKNELTFRAQLRESCEEILERKKEGRLPALAPPEALLQLESSQAESKQDPSTAKLQGLIGQAFGEGGPREA